MNEKVKKWVDAVKQLTKDPNSKVVCPECDNGFLILTEVPAEQHNKVDWYLKCDTCGQWNVLSKSLSQ